jgi:nitrous oxide reductase
MSNNTKTLPRRRFFVGATALAGTAVVLAKTSAGQKVVAEVEDALSTTEKKGYQLTEHIQKYYKTTLV